MNAEQSQMQTPQSPASLPVAPDLGLRRAWIGYVAPMAVFMALTLLEGSVSRTNYVWLYIVKVFAVSGTLLAFRAPLRDYRFEARGLLPGLLVGLAVFALWIKLDPLTAEHGLLHLPLGKRVAFDPNTLGATQRTLFLAFRLFGLALMVPIMEELFWRSFLIRYITTEKFQTIAPWAFSTGAFAAVCGLFALSHPEWLAALVCAMAYGLLLRQTRSLFACCIAHAVTNLALGIYVLTTHNWFYW